MAKEPLPGRVKTRLAKEVGSTVAAWWFRHQLKKTIRNLSDPRWDIIISLSPDFFVKKVSFGHLKSNVFHKVEVTWDRKCEAY